MPVPDPIVDGDIAFVGVNARLDPGQLPEGFVANAVNKRFTNGVVKTRSGIKKMPWSNKSSDHYENKTYAHNDIVRFSGKKKNTNGTITFATGAELYDGVQLQGANAVTFQSFVLCIDRVNGTQYNGVTVSALSAELTSGSIITLEDGIRFELTQQANSGATSISGKVFGGSIAVGKSGFPAGAGPASNNAIGPYFRRKNLDNGNIHVPLSNATTLTNNGQNPPSEYWENLGHCIFGYGEVFGVGIFRDPGSREYLLVATNDGVYATTEGGNSKRITALTITKDVTFVQCFNVVVMMRGKDERPLVMKNLSDGFVAITTETTDTDIDENDSDGTEEIPSSDHAMFLGNRLFVPHSRDLVAVSDYLNYTRYQPVMANFRINQGSEDELVALIKVDSTTVAAFKSNSIYVVSNLYGNATDAILDEVTRDFGAVSFKSTIQVGSDVWFLSSKKGICSLSVASHGKVHAVQLPVSEAIQPIIDRINWPYAHKAVAATYGNRYYCAVCLDGAEENNAVLVYDLLQKAWSGYDQAADVLKVKDFVEMEFQGKRRLFFLSTDGFINLYDDELTMCGFVDEKPKTLDSTAEDYGAIDKVDVSDEVTTRGYTANDIAIKKWRSADIQMATSNPSFSITAIYDGPEEDDQSLTLNADGNAASKSFDRTLYDKPFDAAPFDASIKNNDFATKYRQDYSIDVGTTPIHADFNTTFDPDLHQTSINKYKFNGNGRYVQFKIANTQGRLELDSVKAGALQGETLIRKEI
tara:strand:+ start:2189 stop:4453 length:2265 start_codon:yes stop_codon:yes gene_type:complete